jgi:hypothetical protein
MILIRAIISKLIFNSKFSSGKLIYRSGFVFFSEQINKSDLFLGILALPTAIEF